MKRKSSFGFALCFLGAATAFALTPSEWKYRQSLEQTHGTPLKFSLPLPTLDAAQPDLRDLRLLGPDGRELPYLLIRPAAEPIHIFKASGFRAEIAGDTTVLTVETGSPDPLDWIELQTGAVGFLKAARVDLSTDGHAWETLATGAPLFRQDGAAQTRLSLERRRAAFVRVILDDRRTPPIAVTGALLRTAVPHPAPTEPLVPRIVHSEEFAGETVLTLDLGAAHLSLATLAITATDPLFTRTISLAVRELHDGEIGERVIAQDTLFRVALEGLPAAAKSSAVVAAEIPSRELIVHIQNGDSPPLHIEQVLVQRNPVYIVATPAASGRIEILSGNPHAELPRYDLAPLAAELNRLPLSTPPFSDLAINTEYHEASPLAGLALQGAALDTANWTLHKTVALTTTGVQQIELDLDVLAGAQTDLRDLRLLRDGKQLPYILERTGLTRDLQLTPIAVPDSRRPTVSRWKITLPRRGIPLSRLALNSPTTLFARALHLYEIVPDFRGEPYQRSIANTGWTRTPGTPLRPLVLSLSTRLLTDTLWIETDNGDNPPIALDQAQAAYPVNRLLAASDSSQPIALFYGNEGAATPRYDMNLVAVHLLASEKFIASLGPEQGAAAKSSLLPGLTAGVLFWAVLAVVVVLLLIVVAKLLPKPAKPQ